MIKGPKFKTLTERVQHLEDLTGISQAEATRRGGFKNSAFINDIFRGHKEGVRGVNLAKLALAYGTTAAFLLGETDDPVLPGVSGNLAKIDDIVDIPTEFVEVRFGGIVEAGTFREIDEIGNDTDEPPFYDAPDREFPSAKLYRFTVAGDSMNALKPRPILPGDTVICIDFESLRNRVPLRDGMVVVVERTTDGGLHRERSVKQLELYEDRAEFCPRSTNPKHKPIIVPNKIDKDQTESDGVQVTILAIVRRVSNDIPL